MFHECLNYKKPLSLIWFLFSRVSIKHTCTHCKTTFAWTFRRRIVGGIVGAISGMLPLSLFILFDSLLIGVFLALLIIFAIMVFTPGQYSIYEK